MWYWLRCCNLLIESKLNLIIATYGNIFMFVKRNIWKCDGIQLSLLFIVYSDEKHFWLASLDQVSTAVTVSWLLMLTQTCAIKIRFRLVFTKTLTICFWIGGNYKMVRLFIIITIKVCKTLTLYPTTKNV